MKITLTDPRTSVTLQPRNFTVTLSGARGPAGQGLPAGGAEGQIIVKQSATDYDTAWADNYATNVELYVKNSTAGAMTKGQVVYVSGADGTNPTVTLAQATSEGGSSKTIGVLKQDLAVGAQGYVITDGLLEGLNTNSASAAGDTIWLSPTTAGGVVYGDANKPSAPNHMVFIGYVLRKNTNNGKIFVKVMNGFELQELHNVAISNPVTGQVLKYNGTTGLWSNDTDAGGINTLNGLTTSTQTFITGTSGTDFGIVSATGTHTFNLPTASASARGLLSSADWSTFNGKQGALTLTTTGSSGAATLVGNTLNIPQYSGSTISLTTTGTSGAATLVGSTLNIPQYQSALTNPVTGTGTSGHVAYFNGTSTVTGSANLFWDAVNSRLGVGTNTLTERFHVNGNIVVSNDSFFYATTGGGSVTSGFQLNTSVPRIRFFLNGTARFIISNSTTATIQGSGTTSSTTALLVQNGTPTTLFSVRDDGFIAIGNSSDRPIIFPFSSAAGIVNLAGTNLSFYNYTSTQSAAQGLFSFENTATRQTSGISMFFRVLSTFAPTSGNGTFTIFNIDSTINQTGGANGITRGLYVNPTLTAAADWRSIETSNNTGWAAYFAGTADLFFNNGTDLQFGTGTGTKIGTANTQKLSFWNATPVAQPTTAIAEATFTENSGGTAINVDSTFAGYTLQQIAQALKDIGILQ